MNQQSVYSKSALKKYVYSVLSYCLKKKTRESIELIEAIHTPLFRLATPLYKYYFLQIHANFI